MSRSVPSKQKQWFTPSLTNTSPLWNVPYQWYPVSTIDKWKFYKNRKNPWNIPYWRIMIYWWKVHHLGKLSSCLCNPSEALNDVGVVSTWQGIGLICMHCWNYNIVIIRTVILSWRWDKLSLVENDLDVLWFLRFECFSIVGLATDTSSWPCIQFKLLSVMVISE